MYIVSILLFLWRFAEGNTAEEILQGIIVKPINVRNFRVPTLLPVPTDR